MLILGEVLLGMFGGGVRLGSPTPLILLQIKICNFPVTFSGLASKIHIPFQTWSLESIPIFRRPEQNGQNLYPISNQNNPKTTSFGATPT